VTSKRFEKCAANLDMLKMLRSALFDEAFENKFRYDEAFGKALQRIEEGVRSGAWAERALGSLLLDAILNRLLRKRESSSPPRFFEFLLFLIPIRQRDHVAGDLEEEYRSVTVPKYGKRLASTIYAWQVSIEITRAVITGARGVAFGWLFAKLSK
jgi:hypothetical protein